MSTRTPRLARTSVTLAVAALLATVTSGCEYRGASSLPLPGGKGGGGYTVTAVFNDVTNLVPKETCRAGDVVVGSVESVELRKDMRATVVCRIERDVRLAGNAVATLLIGTWTKQIDREQVAAVLAGQRPFDESTLTGHGVSDDTGAVDTTGLGDDALDEAAAKEERARRRAEASTH